MNRTVEIVCLIFMAGVCIAIIIKTIYEVWIWLG